jgi:hypothetical protein
MNDLIATKEDIDPTLQRGVLTGLSIAEDARDVTQAILSGEWVAAGLSLTGGVLNVATTLIDPFSGLASMGVEWAMEQFQPLKEVLDSLTGDTEIIETHAITWDNMAGELAEIGDELKSKLDGDIPGWKDTAADAYRAMLAENIDIVYGAASTAESMAAATRGGGALVQTVRDMVRGFIADCVARVCVWIAEEVFTLGLATPVVMGQLAVAVVKWIARVFGWVSLLVTSLVNLKALIDG